MNTEQAGETHCCANTGRVSTPEGSDLKKGALRRTPFSKFKKVHSNFKSPLQVSESTKVSPAEEVAELESKREQLDAEIAQLEAEGYRVEELDHHIDMLHEYNDIKDIGQSLLGRIVAWREKTLCHEINTYPKHMVVEIPLLYLQPAALRGTTTRDLYSHFGLELDD